MANKTTFLSCLDRIDYAESMNDDELGKLFRKILQHENGVEEIELPLEFKFAWEKIRRFLDTNLRKREEKIENSSKGGKNHKGNQYTKGDEERNSSDKAQKNTVGVMGVDGSVGSEWNMSDTYKHNTITSSKKEEKKKRKEEMLEAFRNDTRLTPYMDEADVVKWLDYKEGRKEPYKDIDSFITALVRAKNNIAKYGGTPKSDRNRRNRFNYEVKRIIEGNWSGLKWYDSFEQDYLDSKDDLYPNPKQNE